MDCSRRNERSISFDATMWKNGRLLATYKDGRAHLNAYLDDYAFMLDGLIELMQAEFRVEDLAFAQELAERAAGSIRRQSQRRVFLHQPRS